MNLPSCSLKVGIHIPPGEYMLTSLNGKDSPVTIYSSCRLLDKNMLTFEYLKGNKFFLLKKGNVITYENCKIELVEDAPIKTSTPNQQESEDWDDNDFYAQLKEEQTKDSAECLDSFVVGFYDVGEDLPAGEYAILSDGAKETIIKVTEKGRKKERVSFSFSGSCLLTLCQGDSFEIRNGRAEPIDKVGEIPKTSRSYMLKVGTHVAEGKYQLKQANNNRFAVYYILQNSMMNLDEAIDSDAIFGVEELTLEAGQYVYLENAILEKIG